MIRLLSIAAAATLAALPLTATAQAPAYYVATPVAAASKPVVITNGIAWRWTAPTYVASESTQRDVITCQMIAQNAGKLSSFSAGGKAFDEPTLQKCNARAR